MAIERRHLIYAAKNSLWVPVAMLGLLAFEGYHRDAEQADYLYGSIPAVVIGVGFFLYWLWRTQRTLPMAKGRD